MTLLQNVPARLALLLIALNAACVQSAPDTAIEAAQPADAGCMAGGGGSLQAALRGAMVADLAWRDAQMQCEGGMRPDGKGLRVTIAGPLPAAVNTAAAADAKPLLLRFIFGIDLEDSASGAAQALPTNLTVIVEGGEQLYATQGDDKCAVETLQRSRLAGQGGKQDQVTVRGYCVGPASDLAGTARLLVPTFSFTAVVNNGDDP